MQHRIGCKVIQSTILWVILKQEVKVLVASTINTDQYPESKVYHSVCYAPNILGLARAAPKKEYQMRNIGLEGSYIFSLISSVILMEKMRFLKRLHGFKLFHFAHF